MKNKLAYLFIFLLLASITFAESVFPTWSNQSQNVTITSSPNALLSVQLQDETALDTALLSTNESGSWKNYTTQYFLSYQESANQTLCTGTWASEPYQCSNLYDGNWDTSSWAPAGFPGNAYFNYSKSTNVGSAIWEVKDWSARVNITVPSDCFSQNILQFRVYSVTNSYVQWYCFNSSWKLLRQVDRNDIAQVYEEAVWWSSNSSWANFSWSNSSITDKTVGWQIFFNDTSGNTNATNIMSFTVDSVLPYAQIALPANTTYNSTARTLNYTATDTNLQTVWYSYNGTNTTLSGNTSFTSLTGTSTITLFANDTAGNVNSTSMTFSIESTTPNIYIALPANTTYASTTRTLNYTATDNGVISACWYNYNGTNTTLANCLNASFTALDNQQSTIILFINDTAGNTNSTNATFTVDTILPTITIQNPANITYNNTLSIPLDVSISETTSWCGYSLNGAANVTFTPNTTITATSATSQYVQVFCNDTVGWMNSSEIRYFSLNSNVVITKTDGTALDSIVVESDDTTVKTYLMNNTGVTALTFCNLTFVNRTAGTSLNPYASFNASNFNLSAGQNTSFTMTLANVPASGSIYYQKVLATCAETTTTMAVDISSSSPAAPPPSGGGGGSSEPEEPVSKFVWYQYGGKYVGGFPLQYITCSVAGAEKTIKIVVENRGTVIAIPKILVDDNLTGIVKIITDGKAVAPNEATVIQIISKMPENSTIDQVFSGYIYLKSETTEQMTVQLTNSRFCFEGGANEPFTWLKNAFWTPIYTWQSSRDDVEPLIFYVGYAALIAGMATLRAYPDKKLAGVFVIFLVLFGGTLLF